MSRKHEKYDRLIARCKELTPALTAVAHPCDENSLRSAVEASELGILKPILVGPRAKIEATAIKFRLNIAGCEIVNASHSHAAADLAVQLAREGKAEMLMKGSLHTDELMGAVVNGQTGLRTERRISHAFIMDVPALDRVIVITDAAINIFPTLEDKVHIVQNAIDLARTLGVERPKVAILSAVETVNPKIPSTVEAAALCKMAERKQIVGGILDGPLALDNSISLAAAKTKQIDSPVAGRADILVVPDLEAGNMLAKSLVFMADADAAGVVLGARVPIILTSRADSVTTRLASCAVAALVATARREKAGKELV
jgi:phosphate acetyltransferase